MHSRIVFNLSVLLTLILLPACGSLIPQSQHYSTQIQNDISQIEDWRSLSNSSDIVYLNDLFNDSAVDTLLKRAFAHNPSFQQTVLALDIKRAQLKQTTASQRPKISADLSSTKKENADINYNSSLTVSWQVDLWGKLKDSTNAAEFDLAEQEMLVQSARDSLGADILRSWLELIYLKRDVAIQERRIATLEKNEIFILQRYRSGLGLSADLDSAQLSTKIAHATLTANQQEFSQKSRNLNLLIGQLSKMMITIPNEYPNVVIAAANLPEQTLGQRPDLKASYLAILASESRTAVAYKDLLPSFNLQMMLENTASTVRDSLFVSPLWSLLGQLTAPLYQGGELQAKADIAEIETAIAYQAYKEKLLTAVIEIENYSEQEQSLQIQLVHLKKAKQRADNNLKNYQKSYRTGLVSMLDLLTVQQQTFDVDAQINDTIFSLLSNRINLGLALALEIKQ